MQCVVMFWMMQYYMEPMQTPKIKKLDHIVLTSDQVDIILAFYEQIGFRIHDAGYVYEMYAFDFKINVHKWQHELKPNASNAMPGTLDICMEIDGDLFEFQKSFLEKGLKVTSNALKKGAKGQMQSFYLKDPDGNLLEFCAY